MTKTQNGHHFDVYAPKWPISVRRLVRRTRKISVEFRENISNFKDCIALTLSLVIISSLVNLSKLATRGHHRKNSSGQLTMLVQYGVDIPNSLEVISKCNRNSGGSGSSVVKHKLSISRWRCQFCNAKSRYLLSVYHFAKDSLKQQII